MYIYILEQSNNKWQCVVLTAYSVDLIIQQAQHIDYFFKHISSLFCEFTHSWKSI